MTKIYAFFRHNSGLIIGFCLIPLFLLYAYSCQSVVVSTVSPGKMISRQQLVAEVDLFLANAEAKFEDLDRQDLVKNTIFNSVLDLAHGKPVNPAGVLLVLGNVLGFGAVLDNVRKRTHLNTLKGSTFNGKKEETIEKNVKSAPS